jgi:bacteriocin biosynthesis cyclodehydratase domain-containing protein
MSVEAPASLLPVGEFGDSVAARLKRSFAQASVISELADVEESPVILAAWREPRRLAGTLDSTRSIPWWIPVVYAHPVIRVGPLLSRYLPGCYECLTTRELSLKKDAQITESLWHVYDSEPSAGPRGHLAHHATVAAGLCLGLVVDDHDDHRVIYTYDVLTGSLTNHVFSPLPRCSSWHVARTAEVAQHAYLP